jgi:hypothetical protein
MRRSLLAEVILSEVAESLFWVAATSIPLLSFSSIYPNDRYSTTQRISGYILVHIILQSDAYHECRKKKQEASKQSLQSQEEVERKSGSERRVRDRLYLSVCRHRLIGRPN